MSWELNERIADEKHQDGLVHYVSMYVCTVCMYVCMYVRVYVCMYLRPALVTITEANLIAPALLSTIPWLNNNPVQITCIFYKKILYVVNVYVCIYVSMCEVPTNIETYTTLVYDGM